MKSTTLLQHAIKSRVFCCKDDKRWRETFNENSHFFLEEKSTRQLTLKSFLCTQEAGSTNVGSEENLAERWFVKQRGLSGKLM